MTLGYSRMISKLYVLVWNKQDGKRLFPFFWEREEAISKRKVAGMVAVDDFRVEDEADWFLSGPWTVACVPRFKDS